MCDLEGKTRKEVARQLRLPEGTLAGRLTRGRALLAKRLARHGLAVSGGTLAALLPQKAASAAVPVLVVSSTIRTVTAVAAGQAAATGMISGKVTALTQGVLKTMLLNKLMKATAVLVLVMVPSIGALWTTYSLAVLPEQTAETQPVNKQTPPGAGQAKSEDLKKGTWIGVGGEFRGKETSEEDTKKGDLKNIDRTIVKEPKYGSQPHYALLVFGADGKNRVWLVLDGDVLYVDRNGNGDLTEANERVELDVEASKKVNVAPGAYKGNNVFNIGEVAGVRLQLLVWVRDLDFVPQDDFYKQFLKERADNRWENASLMRISKDGSGAQNPVFFCQKPMEAQISHLNGPLTFTLISGERQTLKRDGRDNIFGVSIGTPGLPTRNSRYSVFAPLTTGEVPANVHPLANFEFLHQDPDKLPIKVEVSLDRRCGGDGFYGPVRVPAEAGKGRAKVVVSFPSWVKGRIAPATFEVPTIEAGER